MKKLLLLCLLALCMACKKQQPQATTNSNPFSLAPVCSKPRTPITNANLLKCEFKQGSYWVFADSLTNVTDTLKISSTSLRAGFVFGLHEYCDTVEIYSMAMDYAQEPDSHFKSRSYEIIPERILCFSKFQSSPVQVMQTSGDIAFHRYDSLFIYDRYYKNVFQTSPTPILQFSYGSGGPASGKTLVSFFNFDYGPLRDDIYNNGQLVSRRLLVSTNIVR